MSSFELETMHEELEMEQRDKELFLQGKIQTIIHFIQEYDRKNGFPPDSDTIIEGVGLESEEYDIADEAFAQWIDSLREKKVK